MGISLELIKELRERTSAGINDCKKALAETNGDIDKAADFLREKGLAAAQKKASRIAAEGLSKVVVKGNKACVVEIVLVKIGRNIREKALSKVYLRHRRYTVRCKHKIHAKHFKTVHSHRLVKADV